MRVPARVVVFDLDDTLAVSKAPIEDRMAQRLVDLLAETPVCIISGGKFEQFQKQVLEHLPVHNDLLRNLHLMPTCGTRYYRWHDGSWDEIYAEDLDESTKQHIIAVLRDGARELGLEESHTWGETIEDRGSQVTFSALGQEAPPDIKARWDPDGSKRRALQQYAIPRLPDLEVRSGGSTSVDVTRKGIDKAYGMKKLVQYLDITLDDILFVGDRLDEGGNDYPVRALGVRCVAVTKWQDTADYVEWLLGMRADSPAHQLIN